MAHFVTINIFPTVLKLTRALSTDYIQLKKCWYWKPLSVNWQHVTIQDDHQNGINIPEYVSFTFH